MWNRLREKMPKSWNTTRIENRFGGGIPDVHVCAESLPFWIELKVTKTNRVNVSAHQVAWNFAYSQSGGVSFFLVEALSSSNLYLFDGVHGRGLAQHARYRSGSGRVGGEHPLGSSDRVARSLVWDLRHRLEVKVNPGRIAPTGVLLPSALGSVRRH